MRAQEGRGLGGEQPEGQVVQVEVEDVELVGALVDLLQHVDDRRQRVADLRVEARRPRPHGHEPRRGGRVAAGEQGHVVAQRDQFFREVGHHPLGAAVALGGTASASGAICAMRILSTSPLRANGSNGSVFGRSQTRAWALRFEARQIPEHGPAPQAS